MASQILKVSVFQRFQCQRTVDDKEVRSISRSLSLFFTYHYLPSTWMYRCPCCRIEAQQDAATGAMDHDLWEASHMINPEGCCKYRTAAGAVKRVRVRGLIYCRKCHVQWARDFSAALNIGYAFAYAMSLESWERPRYLSTW